MGMRRNFRVCVYEFLSMVAEGVALSVHKVVIPSLVILPYVHLTATEGELRLMEVASR